MADYRLTQSGDEVQEILNHAATKAEVIANTQAINAETARATGVEGNLQQLITQVQNSLLNYYLKSETYSAAQIDALLAAIKQFRYQVVDQLPTPSAETMGIVYLVPSAHAVSGNVKDEYITLTRDEGSGVIYYFEQIGDTAVDLSNYSTTAQMNAAIAAALEAYYTKVQVNALIADFITRSVNDLVNYYTKSQTYTQAEINALIAAVKQFRYQSVQTLPTASADTMNVIYLVPSTNPKTQNAKDEFITISATDQGTTTYSWEQIGTTTIDLSDYYTKAQTDAAITAALNTALAAYSTTVEMNAAIVSAIAAALADYSTTTQVGQLIATALEAYYTKQEVDALIANFITASVNNLVNYYLKSETFTKAEVNALIATVKQFRYQSVAELPTASAETVGIIYLVPSTNPDTRNVKDEYITLTTTEEEVTTYSWEQIGSTTVDLSGYYTSTQTDAAITAAINAALASYSTTQQMNAAIVSALAAYYTKQEVDALIANFITNTVNNLVNYYLKSETYTKAEVQQLIAAVKQFTYVSVAELPTASADTMNKIYLVPSTNPATRNVKDEFITISVTDQGTTTYSWEQIGSTAIDLSGYYTSAQTDAAINTALASYSTTTQMNAAIATAIAAYYTKTEVDTLIANFITASVNNLVNYYLKSETYTKTEVQTLIDAIKQFTYEVVQTLPTASASTVGKIYLVPNADPQAQNVKDEYITLTTTEEQTTTYSWEKIGSTSIDLSNYYTRAQTDAAITAAINTALTAYMTSAQVTQAISLAVANYYTKTEMDTALALKATKAELTAEENRAKGVEGNLNDRVSTIEEYIPAISGTLPTVFTLEANSDPEFPISNQGAAERYIQQMGGYLLLVHNGHVYAAKLDKNDWDKFADGETVTQTAKNSCETMIHLPTCNFRATGKECIFGGLTPVSGGHSFDSPAWVGAYQMGATGHSRPGEGSGHTHTMTEFWNMAQAIGSDFGLANWGFHCLINCVYQARFGDLDSETLLSMGNERSTESWGAYRDLAHGMADSLADGTGCVAAVDSASITRYVTKLFGFEDLFGKLWEFRPGIRFHMSSSTRIATIYSGNQVSNSASGRTISGVLSSASGEYSTAMELGAYWDMLPKAVGGSATTYYCDGYWASTGGELLIAGCYAADGSRCGLAYVRSDDAFSLSGAAVGARLAFYGNPEIVSGSELLAMLA